MPGCSFRRIGPEALAGALLAFCEEVSKVTSWLLRRAKKYAQTCAYFLAVMPCESGASSNPQR